MEARVRSPRVMFLIGWALAFASCTEEAPTGAAVAMTRCSTRADCPPLPDHEVFCEEGGCVARATTGALRGDCDRSGRYRDDLTRDDANCGACGRRCVGPQRCEAGGCVGSCAGGDALCGEACVDLRRDTSHCGACGRACGRGEACFGGRCDLACAAGQAACASGCATLATDPVNCGACEDACVGGRRCIGGACACGPGQTVCDGACVDTRLSTAHCGACGHACAGGMRCELGACVDACGQGATTCDGACRDLQGDAQHCGACRRRCGAQERCVAGACVPCPADTLRCGGQCVDPRTTAAHCGACNAACPGGVACAEGHCRLTCQEERDARGNQGDGFFATSDGHCGACDARCGWGQHCADGRCVGASPRPKAPLSAARVTSARPWLRWALLPGADGARVELCDAPSCARVAQRWEAVGESLRAPEALRPGVYFWRLFEHRGGRFADVPGPVWEFVVPERPGAADSPVGPVADFNRDGLVDGFVLDTPAGAAHFNTRRLRVYLGTPSGPSTVASQTLIFEGRYYDPYPWLRVSYGPAHDPMAAGDVNGDGYADLLIAYANPYPYTSEPLDTSLLFLGNAGGVSGSSELLGRHPVDSPAGRWIGPAADHDGDGFGDLTNDITENIFWGGRILRYGAAHNGLYCSTADPSTPTPRVRGDFNADGADEVVYEPCGPYPLDADVFHVVPMFPGSRTRDRPTYLLHGCDLRRLSYERWARDVRVADDDGDGFDDLLVWTGATPTARAVFPGGPDGLVDGRCTRLP